MITFSFLQGENLYPDPPIVSSLESESESGIFANAAATSGQPCMANLAAHSEDGSSEEKYSTSTDSDIHGSASQADEEYETTPNSSCTHSQQSSGPQEVDEFEMMVDVLCLSCNQLLHRPIVLNCGHGRCLTWFMDLNLSHHVLKPQFRVCNFITQFLLFRHVFFKLLYKCA